MPRAPSEKKAVAEKLFKKGLKLADIAKKLDVPEGTVRSWKNRSKWDNKSIEGQKCNVANDDVQSNATLQKKKRGGQQGNKNSVGHLSSVPKMNKNAEKHGAFSKIYFKDIEDDEWELIRCMEDTEEKQLILQLQLFAVRERRLMSSIKKYRELETENHGLFVEGVSKTKKVEDITDIEGESLKSGKYKKVTETTLTHTKAVMGSIVTLEAELTKIQKAKTKAIEALAQIRAEKQKTEGEMDGSGAVDDWIDAVLGEDAGSDGV